MNTTIGESKVSQLRDTSVSQQRPVTNQNLDLPLVLILLMAMALPMLVLYANGALASLMLVENYINPTILGTFTLSAFGVAAILSLNAGRWVKKWGIRSAMVSLFLLTGLSFTVLIWVEHWLGMALAIAVCGIAQALANPATNQAIAAQVPAPQKALMVGVKQSGVQLSALAAGSVLSMAAITWGWRAAFALMIPLCLGMAGLAAGKNWQAKVPAQRVSVRGKGDQRLLASLMIMQAGVGITLAAFITQIPLIAAQIGMTTQQAAFLITLFGGMGIVSRLILTPLASKFRHESELLLRLYPAAGLALLCAFNATDELLWLIHAGVVGIGMTLVASNAVAMAMVIKYPAFGDIPTASGRVSAAFFGGLAIGSLLFQMATNLTPLFHAGLGLLLLCMAICGGAAVFLRNATTRDS
ncbi:MFS transporter [Photobacterium sp. TY1-4]|uniref:MFS transporter n=1 Tax=Photobacterium sp. TY1-4 TaxID=2899122 RepID=UPI0021C06BF1|nr:MFS transporter [Photobacterium sp. TY1-4]UXI02724.1 MFS transporter [Photobacterium sp. TY1-4]